MKIRTYIGIRGGYDRIFDPQYYDVCYIVADEGNGGEMPEALTKFPLATEKVKLPVPNADKGKYFMLQSEKEVPFLVVNLYNGAVYPYNAKNVHAVRDRNGSTLSYIYVGKNATEEELALARAEFDRLEAPYRGGYDRWD
jgi:hypothetical protein